MTTVPPSVDVVIPTRDRPELLRRAVESVLAQEYAGALSVTIVFDGETPDRTLAGAGRVPVRVLANDHAAGLAGTRNTGILSSGAELIAFVDDDDRWHPPKLARQVEHLMTMPDAVLATTAIEVDYDGIRSVRLADRDRVLHAELLTSRLAMLHSSTFLIRREELLGRLGLVDESAPSGQNEDWDLLLRASAIAPIAHLDEPLAVIQWGRTSKFSAAWRSRIAGAEWIVERHPDIRDDKVGYARVLGQIAFGHASLGERRQALRAAVACAKTNWREPRAYIAAAVAAGVPGEFVQSKLHDRGHGI